MYTAIDYLTKEHGWKISSDPRTYSDYPNNYGLRNYTANGINYDADSGGYHRAFDLYNNKTDNVPSVTHGTVVRAVKRGAFGGEVVIKDYNGYYWVYGHLQRNSIKLKKGDKIRQGDLIGLQGNSNYYDNPMDKHLHIQLLAPNANITVGKWYTEGLQIDRYNINNGDYLPVKGNDTVVKTHLIISGHGGNDPGAIGNGTNERDFTRNEVTPRIIKRINATPGHEAVEYNRARNMYVETANGGGMYNYNSNSYDTMTELHLDAFNGTAEDGHVIIATGLLPDSIDKRLADAIDQYVGVRHGGINQRDNLLQVNVAKNRGINYRLVELGFIDNRAEMTAIRTYIDEYCNELADAITGGSGAAKAPVQAAVPKPQGVSKKGWGFAGTFVADETIVVRRGYKSSGAPRLHLNEPVSEGSYLQPGDFINFDHIWFADGFWWGRFKYPGRKDSTYYFAPLGVRDPRVEFSKAKLWGKLTKLNMKKGSKVTDWHKRNAIK